MAPSRSRSRSRSPPRKKEPKFSGLRWKDKSRNDSSEQPSRLERGYRDRSPRRRDDDRREDRYRPRSPRRDDRYRDRSPRREDRGRDRAGDRDGRRDEGVKEKEKEKAREEKREKREKREKKTAMPVSTEPMIIVHVNDRLGTKAAIPCLASDPVKAFKAMVAARIGRQPHEIMLKRQGERPFKDQLTLEDYGVSNGVQLDLELDTGD